MTTTAYGYVNTCHYNRAAEGDRHWFATREERDADMLALRARAAREGIDEATTRASIYPVTSPITDAIAREIEDREADQLAR